MSPLELAKRYMAIFYSGESLDDLRPLVSDDLSFKGPFLECHSAHEYIASLKSDPPNACEYVVLNEYESDTSACLIYQFSKPGVTAPMAQVFDVRDGKIAEIKLIFDTRAFT